MSSRVNGVLAPDGRLTVAFGSISASSRIEGRDERLNLVVAERPEELRGDLDRPGPAFRETRECRTAETRCGRWRR